ncbi:hypothetical protein ACFL3S_09490 [Gemmatimonadota bacterium]
MSHGNLERHGGEPYENTDKCWGYLNRASKAARYLGYVEISDVVDHRNPDPYVLVHYQTGPNARFDLEPPELEDPEIYVGPNGGFNLAMVQPYHLELWFEKSTMNDVLLPVCQGFGANLVTGLGEMSIASAYSLVQRIKAAAKPTRIFYGSDFDPAGHSMPRAVARKLEWMLSHWRVEEDVRLAPVVLTLDQVREYRLPRTPIKEKERRAGAFEDRFGEGAVELDALEALHPGALALIVRNSLDPYFNREAEVAARAKERLLRQAIRERVSEITGRYTAEIKALEAMREELSSVEIPDLEEYEPDVADPLADEPSDGWLFDSRRDYVEQLRAFKRYGAGLVDPRPTERK